MATVTINTGVALVPPEAVITFSGGSTAPINASGESYSAQLSAVASSDPDGTIANYAWYFRRDGGDWQLIENTISPFYQYTVTNTGQYDFKVEVTDNDNLKDESGIITVNFTGDPVINCNAKINGNDFQTKFIAPAGSNFVLDGTDSEPGNSWARVSSYSWTINQKPSGSLATLSNPASAITNVGPLDVVGSYFVELEINSSNGTTDSVVVEIEMKDTDSQGNYI